ncbi:MAG: hypothetical protein ACQEQ4_01455 [Fibrobacterota bacterium]
MKVGMLLVTVLFALSADTFSWGFSAGGGWRYDNIRMCVATDPGVKGGPMADIKLLGTRSLSQDKKLRFALPLMRPVLFGLRFDMVQFEPDVTLEMYREINQSLRGYFGPGAGISLHYGPDYTSDTGEHRKEDFWAFGPTVSAVTGLAFTDTPSSVGLRMFYTPLFSTESDLSVGTVLGVGLEYTMDF